MDSANEFNTARVSRRQLFGTKGFDTDMECKCYYCESLPEGSRSTVKEGNKNNSATCGIRKNQISSLYKLSAFLSVFGVL